MAPRAAERTSEVREGDTAAVQRPLEPLIRRDTQEGRVRGRQQRRVRARVHPHGLSATRGQRTAPVRIGTARGFGRRFGRRNGTPLGAAAAGGGRGGTERTELWEERFRAPKASVTRRAAACSAACARAQGGGPAAPPSSCGGPAAPPSSSLLASHAPASGIRAGGRGRRGAGAPVGLVVAPCGGAEGRAERGAERCGEAVGRRRRAWPESETRRKRRAEGARVDGWARGARGGARRREPRLEHRKLAFVRTEGRDVSG